MPLVVPDEVLRQANLTELEARVEFACALFDAGRMSAGHAARFAGLTADAFERELERRGVPRYRYTEEMLREDMESFRKLDLMKEGLASHGQDADTADRRERHVPRSRAQ